MAKVLSTWDDDVSPQAAFFLPTPPSRRPGGVLTTSGSTWSPLVTSQRLWGRVMLGQKTVQSQPLSLSAWAATQSWSTRQWHSNSLTEHSRKGVLGKRWGWEGADWQIYSLFCSPCISLSVVACFPTSSGEELSCFCFCDSEEQLGHWGAGRDRRNVFGPLPLPGRCTFCLTGNPMPSTCMEVGQLPDV